MTNHKHAFAQAARTNQIKSEYNHALCFAQCAAGPATCTESTIHDASVQGSAPPSDIWRDARGVRFN
eukprot:2153005-Prymnesium_polylepis.1